jgi:hypothetical protein
MSDGIAPLTPEQTAQQEAQAAKEGYIHKDLVGLDQFANVLSGGNPDETISSRLARSAEEGHEVGKIGSEVLDKFQTNHGPKAQAGDIERAERVEKLEENSGGIK